MSWANAYIKQLQAGEVVKFRPCGNSMRGRIEHKQLCTVEPVTVDKLQVGDIVLCKVKGRQYLHCIKARRSDQFQIANNRGHKNGWMPAESIYGICINVEN